MHRRHPGPGIADLAALRGAPRQASGSSAGVLPADLPDGAPSGGDRGPELQGALDDRHAVAENDPLRALVQRLKAIELSHLQGNWTQAERLELVKTGSGRPCSSKSSKQPSRNVVAGGSDRRGWSRSRGERGKQGSAGSRAGLALLDGMPEEIGQQRAQIDKHLANVNVAQAYRTIMARVVTGKAQEEAAFNFAGVVIDNIDLPSDTLLGVVGQKFGVLLDEDGPQVSKAFAELFGLGAPAVEGGPEPPDVLLLLARRNGVEVREYRPGWRGSDGGIYVGRGGGGLPCSVFQEAYYEQLVPGQVKEALDGRALYVHKGEEEAAYGLISSFVLSRSGARQCGRSGWSSGFWAGPPRLLPSSVSCSAWGCARSRGRWAQSLECCPAALKSTSSRCRWSFFRWRFRRRSRTWYG